MKESAYSQFIESHIRTFFAGHDVSEHQWKRGPLLQAMPDFRVLCVSPGNRIDCWTYLSFGASSISHDNDDRLEFLINAPSQDVRYVELVTMVTWYHKTERLGLGHTMPIGEPWVPESKCNHLLVSLPYPFGPDLEFSTAGQRPVRLLWLLPITQAERDYKVANDLEMLEQRFDQSQLEFWNIHRESVV